MKTTNIPKNFHQVSIASSYSQRKFEARHIFLKFCLQVRNAVSEYSKVVAIIWKV